MPVSIFKKYEGELYVKVFLQIDFRDKLLAGIPQSGSMLDYFINLKQMSDDEKEDFVQRIRHGAMTEEEKKEMKETSWTMFERDREGFLSIWANNAKAMMREIFSVTGSFMEKRASSKKGEESASGKQTYQHALHLEGTNDNDPVRLRILTNGMFKRPEGGEGAKWEEFEGGEYKAVKEPHGYVDRVKHITDASGKRSAIGRHDFFDRPRIQLIMKWLANDVYKLEEIEKAWFLAQDNGLGASRSQGFGKFDVTEWKVLSNPAPTRKMPRQTKE